MMSVSSEDPMLSVGEVVSGYGDLTVLNGISLDVPRGTVEVILGRNGVGKTTLLSSIAGLVPLDSGEVFCDGQAIGRRASYRRAAAGVALVQEGKRIFRGMSVMDNVLLGAFTRKVRRSERQARCLELLDQFPMLHDRLHQSAGSLSGGQQQMLAIAQALASEPRVLLLDEPSAGLAPTIVADVFQRVRALRDDGLTIVLVEQLAEQALAIADHVTVIDDGRVVQSGAPEAFDDLQALHEAYFGAPAAAGA